MNIIDLRLQEHESIAFMGDLHCDNMTPSSRIDDYLTTLCYKLRDIQDKCIKNNVKALFFEGDIFNRIQVTNECVNRVIDTLWKFRDNDIKLFTIAGNHDLVRNQIDNIEKTPLATLFHARVIEHINLDNRVVINKRTLITPCDYTEYPDKAFAKAKFNILLAHMFYNDEFASGPEHNLKDEDLRRLGYNAAVFGHDHRRYPIMQVCGADIIRSGSLMRATSHSYQQDQRPCFMILKQPWEYNVNNWVEVEIAHKPFQDVLSNTVVNKKVNLADLSTLMADLVSKVTLSSSNDSDVDEILETVKTDPNLDIATRELLLSYFSDYSILS